VNNKAPTMATPAGALPMAMPDHSASAIMSEIYISLVTTETLASEICSLEGDLVEAEQAVDLSNADAEASLLAAEEALEAAAHEKSLRQKAQTKLRLLQAEKNAAGASAEELEQCKLLASDRERELKLTLSRLQHANEAAARGANALKADRQQARLQQRRLAAHRLIASFRLALWAAAHRAFTTWASKVAAGIFDYAPLVPRPSPLRRSTSPERRARVMNGHIDESILEEYHATIAARNAECFELREEVTALRAQLALEGSRSRALRAATDRAAHASAELLLARRRNGELVDDLATANAALQRMQAERWREEQASLCLSASRSFR
jgi:hypothetical protein